MTVLGSGGSEGIPVPYCPCNVCHSGDTRCRTSYLIGMGNTHLLAEISPDFRRQQLRHGFSVDYLFISHEHKDHIGGLSELKQIMLVAKIKKLKPIHLIISKRFHAKLMRHSSTDKEGIIHSYRRLIMHRKLIPHVLDYNKIYEIGGFRIMLFKNKHGNIACDGFLIEHNGRSVVYVADAGSLYKKTEDIINKANPDLLIANTPFFFSTAMLVKQDRNTAKRKRLTHHIGIDLIEHLRAKRLLLNHFSHKSGMTHDRLLDMSSTYRNVIIGRDGLIINV